MDLRALLSNAQSSLSNTYDNSVDSLIDRLGLERQRSTTDSVLPAIGIFSAGLAVGAVLGLIFAPKKGEELREDITDQMDHLKDQMDHLTVKTRRQYEEFLLRGEELLLSAKNRLPTRDDLDEAARKVEHKAKHAADEVDEVAHEVASKVGHGAHRAADEVENVAEKAASVAERAAHSAKEKVEKIVSHGKK